MTKKEYAKGFSIETNRLGSQIPTKETKVMEKYYIPGAQLDLASQAHQQLN